MRLENLKQGDSISITNINNEEHKADFLEFTVDGIFLNFKGFGHLEVKWSSLRLIEQVFPGHKRNSSYGPRYKVVLWQA